MRQVRLDELTYVLYSGIGAWSHRDRKAIAADRLDAMPLRIAAAAILRHLYRTEFYDGASEHPLPQKELEELIAGAIGEWPLELRKRFLATTTSARGWVKYDAAKLLASRLADFTILRDSPEPPPMRFADYEGGSGPVAETDAELRRRMQEA